MKKTRPVISASPGEVPYMVVTIERAADAKFLHTLIDECPAATSTAEGERGIRVVDDDENPQNHIIVLYNSQGMVTLWCDHCYDHLDDDSLVMVVVEDMLDLDLIPKPLRQQAEAFVELRSRVLDTRHG